MERGGVDAVVLQRVSKLPQSTKIRARHLRILMPRRHDHEAPYLDGAAGLSDLEDRPEVVHARAVLRRLTRQIDLHEDTWRRPRVGGRFVESSKELFAIHRMNPVEPRRSASCLVRLEVAD